MPWARIPHEGGLNRDAVMRAFEEHFAGRYMIQPTSGLGRRGFMVVRNHFVGVQVIIQQDEDGTVLIYSGCVPRWWALLLLAPLALFLLSDSPFARGLVYEVKEFIETALLTDGRTARETSYLDE